jgi:hypothetical protein
MSELAFNANGESFEIPATVTAWRVRRMKPRGAPELVYGRDGRPLTIGIDADVDDLRDAVVVPGKYRLDPINDDGKCVDNVPAAYIQVMKPQRNADLSETPVVVPHGPDESLREAMRMNTELARAVIDRFPEMMTAAAELLRAADGAGLPSRRALLELEDSDEVLPPPGGFDINTLVAQVVPLIITSLGKGKMPDLAGVLDWRKASPDSATEAPKKRLKAKAEEPAKPDTAELPPIDPQTMAHFIAIQSALDPKEAALARDVASTLGPAELRGWFEELSKLSVPQAVQKIRVLIAGNTEAVS